MKIPVIHHKIFDVSMYENNILKKGKNNDKNIISTVSEVLFNVCFVLKASPNILFPKESEICGNIAKNIQEKFNSLFLKFPSISSLFSSSSLPFILFDRPSFDIPILLHHAMSYGSMTNDLFGVNLNQNLQENSLYLDILNDFIWEKAVEKPFFEVGEETLLQYKKHNDQMKVFSGLIGGKEVNMEVEEREERVVKYISELKNSRNEGDILARHTRNFTKMQSEIKKKMIDSIFEVEYLMMIKKVGDEVINEKISSVLEISDLSQNKYDILRMLVIYYCWTKNLKTKEFLSKLMEKHKIEEGKAMIKYLDKVLVNNVINEANKGNKISDKNTILSKSGAFATKIFKKSLNLIKKVYNSISESSQPSYIGKKLEEFFYSKNKSIEGFTSMQINANLTKENIKLKYNNILCFVLNGGSFGEYEYLEELSKSYGRNLMYGTDKLYSPKEFLEELKERSKCL